MCFSYRLFSVLSCQVFFLSSGWFCLVVVVGGVARLRGCLCVRSASAGSVLVVVVSVLWLCYSWGDETLFFIFSSPR